MKVIRLIVLFSITILSSIALADGILSNVVKAPITPDGDVAGAETDLVISFDKSSDPAVDGHALAAGCAVRVTLPEDFIEARGPLAIFASPHHRITASAVAVGHTVTRENPSDEINTPVEGAPVGRLVVQFRAGSAPGRYTTEVTLVGGNSKSLFVDVM